MLAPTVALRRAHRLYRMSQRLPPTLRRPRPAVRATLIGVGAWFVLLFGSLGLAGGGAPPLATAGFVAAASAGVAGVVLVAVDRIEPSLWCLGAMLVIGQVAALSLPL